MEEALVPRPSKLPEKYGWCGKPHHGTIHPDENGICMDCIREWKRTFQGKCNATLWAGPGHQSKFYCEEIGEHTIHRCDHNGYNASWKEFTAFTGFFDESPQVEE